MIRKWLAATLIACSFQAFSLQNTTEADVPSSHFIRDDLFVFMHTGPGRDYRILGSVDAGTPITVLERDNDAKFTQIEDDSGRTGWIESRYVSNNEPQTAQLPVIIEKLANAQTSLEAEQSENLRLRQELEDAKQQIASLTTTTDEQSAEIIRLGTEIKGSNKEELAMWFTRGGMVAGGGVLFGFLLSFVFKRKRRSSEWM